MADRRFFSQIWSLFGSCRIIWDAEPPKVELFVKISIQKLSKHLKMTVGRRLPVGLGGNGLFLCSVCYLSLEKLLEPRIRNSMLSYFGDAFPVSFLDIPKKMSTWTATQGCPPSWKQAASSEFWTKSPPNIHWNMQKLNHVTSHHAPTKTTTARYPVDEEAVEDIIEPSGWKAKAVVASKETSLGLWPKWFP